MNNISEVHEQYKDQFPHLKSYTECVSRAILNGVVGTFLTFSGTYMAMSLLKNKLPSLRPGNANVLVGGILGSLVGFQMVYTRTRACNASWMAAENKHTYLNPITPAVRPPRVVEPPSAG